MTQAIEIQIAASVKLEVDQHEQELSVLAGAIVYYRIAARRFADYNSLIIRNEIFHLLKKNLRSHIEAEIGLGRDADVGAANDYLKTLILLRRMDLEAELARL